MLHRSLMCWSRLNVPKVSYSSYGSKLQKTIDRHPIVVELHSRLVEAHSELDSM